MNVLKWVGYYTALQLLLVSMSIVREKMALMSFMADFYFSFKRKRNLKMPLSENHLMSSTDPTAISIVSLHWFASVKYWGNKLKLKRRVLTDCCLTHPSFQNAHFYLF